MTTTIEYSYKDATISVSKQLATGVAMAAATYFLPPSWKLALAVGATFSVAITAPSLLSDLRTLPPEKSKQEFANSVIFFNAAIHGIGATSLYLGATKIASYLAGAGGLPVHALCDAAVGALWLGSLNFLTKASISGSTTV